MSHNTTPKYHFYKWMKPLRLFCVFIRMIKKVRRLSWCTVAPNCRANYISHTVAKILQRSRNHPQARSIIYDHANKQITEQTSRNLFCSRSCPPWCNMLLLSRVQGHTCSIWGNWYARFYRSLLLGIYPWFDLYNLRTALRVPNNRKSRLKLYQPLWNAFYVEAYN